jgi:class 3 adenylate cyclase
MILTLADALPLLLIACSIFDRLVEVHGVHKVETAGDCYIVSAGVAATRPDGFLHVLDGHAPAESAARVLAFAKDMLLAARTVLRPHDGQPTAVRIGLHTGPCTSGLIGSRLPKFSIFGDSMNTASRMESTCTPGRIQVSEATHALLQHEQWEATGGVQVKGKVRDWQLL